MLATGTTCSALYTAHEPAAAQRNIHLSLASLAGPACAVFHSTGRLRSQMMSEERDGAETDFPTKNRLHRRQGSKFRS